jgi:hypothetical protein
MASAEEVRIRSRRLAGAIEPFAGQVYFAPECHRNYEALGFRPSPGLTGKVEIPDGVAYFTSRGSVMGQVPGEVVAAAFAVFNPTVVIRAVTRGWTITDAPTIRAARADGATAQLARILGDLPDFIDRAVELLAVAGKDLRPEGRPMYAGVLSAELTGEPLRDAWMLADRLREYRGDCHTAAWITAGFDAVEIGLLSELYWGLPMRTYVRSRAWSDDDLDEAEERLASQGFVANGRFTDAGRDAREVVERVTDEQCRPIIEALGDGIDDLLRLLEPWAAAIREAGGYLASGPHDLAGIG